MTLTTSRSKNSISYYITQSVREGSKKYSKVIERLGSHDELMKRFGEQDTVQKAKRGTSPLTPAPILPMLFTIFSASVPTFKSLNLPI